VKPVDFQAFSRPGGNSEPSGTFTITPAWQASGPKPAKKKNPLPAWRADHVIETARHCHLEDSVEDRGADHALAHGGVPGWKIQRSPARSRFRPRCRRRSRPDSLRFPAGFDGLAALKLSRQQKIEDPLYCPFEPSARNVPVEALRCGASNKSSRTGRPADPESPPPWSSSSVESQLRHPRPKAAAGGAARSSQGPADAINRHPTSNSRIAYWNASRRGIYGLDRHRRRPPAARWPKLSTSVMSRHASPRSAQLIRVR